MPELNKSNSRVDKGSGAIIFNGSSELQELIKLQKRMNTLEHKVDKILALLEGGNVNGRTMENK